MKDSVAAEGITNTRLQRTHVHGRHASKHTYTHLHAHKVDNRIVSSGSGRGADGSWSVGGERSRTGRDGRGEEARTHLCFCSTLVWTRARLCALAQVNAVTLLAQSGPADH